ncbi:hypothetical protein Tco_0779323 [Tanacetum coccineum]
MLNRHKNWLVHKQTACGKDFSNPFMVDNLLKTIRLSIHLVVYNEELAIPEQTATSKGISNPLMAGSFPKTTNPTCKRHCEASPPVKGALVTSGFELSSRCTLPKSIHLDHHDTAYYIPMYHRMEALPDMKERSTNLSFTVSSTRVAPSTPLFLMIIPTSVLLSRLLELNPTQPKTRNMKGVDTFLDPFQMILSELKIEFNKWEVILSENAVSLTGNKDHPNACLCYMLYCLAIGKHFNIAYYITNRMEKGKRPRLPTPTLSNSKSSDLLSLNPNQERENDPANTFTLDPLPYMDQLLPIQGVESLEFKQTNGSFKYLFHCLCKRK